MRLRFENNFEPLKISSFSKFTEFKLSSLLFFVRELSSSFGETF